MATATLDPTVKSLSGAEVKEKLQQVRRPDNLTNWYYLLRSYVFLALIIAGAAYFFEHWSAWGLHWAWNIPVAVVAIARPPSALPASQSCWALRSAISPESAAAVCVLSEGITTMFVRR